jgi:hypothetical protein
MTDDPGTQLRRDIDYNATNLGELGRFIRVDYVLNIIDRYEITADGGEGARQVRRAEAALRVFEDGSLATNDRAILHAVWRALTT